jgi:hypothetical protein
VIDCRQFLQRIDLRNRSVFHLPNPEPVFIRIAEKRNIVPIDTGVSAFEFINDMLRQTLPVLFAPSADGIKLISMCATSS